MHAVLAEAYRILPEVHRTGYTPEVYRILPKVHRVFRGCTGYIPRCTGYLPEEHGYFPRRTVPHEADRLVPKAHSVLPVFT